MRLALGAKSRTWTAKTGLNEREMARSKGMKGPTAVNYMEFSPTALQLCRCAHGRPLGGKVGVLLGRSSVRG